MTRFAIVCLAATIICTSVSAQTSQQVQSPAIGVVDVQKIVHESSAGKGIDIQYDKQHQLFGDKVQQQENDLDAKEQELSRQRTVLTPDAFNQQRQALENYSSKVQEAIQQQSQQNQTAFNDAVAELVSSIRAIVTSVAKEKGLSIVLSQEQTLYLGDGAIDITDIVLNRLDTKLPSITVSVPGDVLPGTSPPLPPPSVTKQ